MNALEEKAAGRPFAQSEIDDIMVECYRSTKLFAKIFFPDRFHLEFSPLHEELFDILDSEKDRYIGVVGHRGWGKTTIMTLVYPAKKLMYRECNFYMPVSCTAGQAERDSEDLKLELLTNENLLAVWQNVKPEGRGTDFSKEFWKTNLLRNKDGSINHYGTLVMPRGWGQQVIGLKHGRFRPDFVMSDDIEGTEGVLSDEQRGKLRDWFYSDLMNIVQRATKLAPGEFPFQFFCIGNMHHQDSLLASLERDKKWLVIRAPLCKEVTDVAGSSVIKYESLWQDFMNDKQVTELYQEHVDNKLRRLFAKQYLCEIVAEEEGFDEKWFKNYEERDLVKVGALESVVIIDPSKTDNKRSAETAIVGWSLDFTNGSLYFRDCVHGAYFHDDLFQEAVDMAKRLKTNIIGVETTGFGVYIWQPFKDFLSLHGYAIDLVELKSANQKGEKDTRIKSLIPYYRQGRVWHNKNCSQTLEMQLIAGAVSRLKDVADAASRVVQMLDLGNRIFLPEIPEEFRGENASKYDQFAELANSYQPPTIGGEPAGLRLPWEIEEREQRVSPRLHDPNAIKRIH